MNFTEFGQKLGALPAGKERTGAVARALSKFFRVPTEDIGIFSFDAEKQLIRFLWPPKLESFGFLPLSSPDSLAAKTLRENKAYLNNRFASTIHPSIFEKVKLDKESEEPPLPVQKIISVPLQVNGEKSGVVQICRKGANANEADADFTKDDLATMMEIAKAIAPHL
ncbi:MAG: hypothetical protein WDA20_09015 [Desulfuromonadales bacterium]|jgi:hypothetical protein